MYVYKYEKCKFDQPCLSFQPKHIFIGKSEVCHMTEFFGAANISSSFDGSTLLLEFENNEYIYLSGLEIIKFKKNDKIIDYISLMGNIMIPYAIIIGEKYTYFIAHHYKFIENNKIEKESLLNTVDGSLDPYDYHVEKCGLDSFKTLEHTRIHTCWLRDDDEEDTEGEDDVLVKENEDEVLVETQYLNGKNEVVKIFIQKCVICYERDSVYAFRQCGHQCICEQCYQNRGNIDILKCVVCGT